MEPLRVSSGVHHVAPESHITAHMGAITLLVRIVKLTGATYAVASTLANPVVLHGAMTRVIVWIVLIANGRGLALTAAEWAACPAKVKPSKLGVPAQLAWPLHRKLKLREVGVVPAETGLLISSPRNIRLGLLWHPQSALYSTLVYCLNSVPRSWQIFIRLWLNGVDDSIPFPLAHRQNETIHKFKFTVTLRH
jgi:hypothetical protein